MITLTQTLLSARAGFFVRLSHGAVSLSPSIVPKQAYQKMSKPLSTVVSDTRMPKFETDLIQRDLKNAATASDLLTIAEKYHAIMNNTHLLTAFRFLVEQVWSGHILPQEVTNSPSFENLLQQTLKFMQFYNPDECLKLLRAVVHLKIDEKNLLTESLKAAIPILFQEKYTKVDKMDHDAVLRKLLDSCMGIITAATDKLDKKDTLLLIGLLKYISFDKALHDHFWLRAAAENWSLAEVAVLAYSSPFTRYYTLENAKMVRDLIIREESELEMLFRDNTLQTMVKSDRSPIQMLDLLDVEQLVRLRFGEEGSASLRIDPVLRSQLLHASESVSIECTTFQAELGVALGGEQFFAKGVVTPLGTRADYLVVMRQSTYPMAIPHHYQQNTPEFFKELPPDSKVAAFVLTKNTSYARGSALPMVGLSVRVELLRAQKMCPVLINVDLWRALKAHERIPFLMRELKAALGVGHIYVELEMNAV
ncbi:hypothetical protein BIW11_12626 [Tropilaelaps mercedesae]|uniref:Uncharacterized protein n=1 Tax=Tropilaelaps mercedesae TaxID=418985 RepID=A0A1V9X647_9ACAR|nr:hypothetical protein BIW11_12626 [Tropilaelaps mercedesae]